MANAQTELDIIESELIKLRNEMEVVLSYTKNLWGTDSDIDHRHFPYTLYGFVMVLMSKIDHLSKHFIPNQTDQTKRMVEFLNTYVGYTKKSSEIAVQFFRHNLMHCSTLDQINDKNGQVYSWLLHGLGTDLSKDQHMTLEPGKLNACAFYFIEDLIAAVPKLQASVTPGIAADWQKIEEKSRTFPEKYRDDGSEIL